MDKKNLKKNRTFQIIIEDKSQKEKITKGVPQGSPISPTLFNILMSGLNLSEKIQKIIYADDITIISQDKDIIKAKTELQTAIKNIKQWTDQWDLKINISKSKLMCFTNRRIRNIPEIDINNEKLIFTINHKILGLIFDAPKLTWKSHLDMIKTSTQKRLDIMKKTHHIIMGS